MTSIKRWNQQQKIIHVSPVEVFKRMLNLSNEIHTVSQILTDKA